MYTTPSTTELARGMPRLYVAEYTLRYSSKATVMMITAARIMLVMYRVIATSLESLRTLI